MTIYLYIVFSGIALLLFVPRVESSRSDQNGIFIYIYIFFNLPYEHSYVQAHFWNNLRKTKLNRHYTLQKYFRPNVTHFSLSVKNRLKCKNLETGFSIGSDFLLYRLHPYVLTSLHTVQTCPNFNRKKIWSAPEFKRYRQFHLTYCTPHKSGPADPPESHPSSACAVSPPASW